MSDRAVAARALVARHLGAAPATIVDTAELAELGADSLDRVELAIAAEEEFGIEVTDDEVERMRTVGDLVSIAERAR